MACTTLSTSTTRIPVEECGVASEAKEVWRKMRFEKRRQWRQDDFCLMNPYATPFAFLHNNDPSSKCTCLMTRLT